MLVIIAVTVVVTYLALMTALFAFQRKLIFPAPVSDRAPARGLVRGEGFVAMHYPGTPTVVHLHGNAEVLWHSEWLAQKYAERGLGFYAVEYPGYGLSAAAPLSEDAICAAVEAALVALEKTVPKDQLVLQGQSLGTGVAVEMAKRGHGSKLILVSPYTSIADVAADAVPFFPARWLVRDRFMTAEKAKDVALPVLIVHGTQDEVIPVAMGKTLGGLFPHARVMLVEGAHHNDLIDRAEVIEAMTAFARPTGSGP